MSLRRSGVRTRGEPTIALINVVFLMLVFFLIAGVIAPPLDARVDLVNVADLDGRAPPDAAVVLADGSLFRDGAAVTIAELVQEDVLVRLVPDQALPASMLISLSRNLRDAGAQEVWIITERGLE